MVYQLRQRERVEHSDIYLILDNLSENDLDHLYFHSRAFITATLGEGFGGPIAKAIFSKIPVVSPSHTALGTFFPKDYPFNFATKSTTVTLKNQLPIYPISSEWNLPQPGAIYEAISTLYSSSDERIRQACDEAYETTSAYCGEENVRKILIAELDRVYENCN
ncbi:MAG: hypothetical protein KDD68_15220 [Bdellovibrionales bacterium]|nr:hypothetical protein [Bdellovibrionales bacterium]